MKEKLIALAKKHGLLIMQSDNNDRSIIVDAPPGYVFNPEDDLHCLVCDSWKDAIERIGEGIKPCQIHDCDTCAEPTTFDELVQLYSKTNTLIFKP